MGVCGVAEPVDNPCKNTEWISEIGGRLRHHSKRLTWLGTLLDVVHSQTLKTSCLPGWRQRLLSVYTSHWSALGSYAEVGRSLVSLRARL